LGKPESLVVETFDYFPHIEVVAQGLVADDPSDEGALAAMPHFLIFFTENFRLRSVTTGLR